MMGSPCQPPSFEGLEGILCFCVCVCVCVCVCCAHENCDYYKDYLAMHISSPLSLLIYFML